MPDNLTFEQAFVLIVLTAAASHWLPGLFATFNNWWLRKVRRVEVEAEANLDNSGAEKNRADAMGTMLENIENLARLVSESQEARLADRTKFINEIFQRDEQILQLKTEIAQLTGRLVQVEVMKQQLEIAQAKINQANLDFETEHEIRVQVQEEYLVAKDKWRLEKLTLEEKIQRLSLKVEALEEKLSRLEKVQISAQEKDESNGRPPHSPVNPAAEPAAKS